MGRRGRWILVCTFASEWKQLMEPKSYISPDGTLTFSVVPIENGDTILRFEGSEWKIHGGEIVGIYGVPRQAAITNYIKALLENRLIIDIWRQGSDVLSVSITNDPESNLQYLKEAKPEGLTIEHRYWDGSAWFPSEPIIDDTASILAEIPGGPELLDWFGGSPNFGDAEVMSLNLNREGPSILRMAVMKWVGTEFETIVVVLTLRDMIDVALEGFSHQNVVGGLTLKRGPELPVHPSLVGIGLCLPDHILELEPCAGAFGRIRATIDNIAMERFN